METTTVFSTDFSEESTWHDASSVTERCEAGEDGIPVKRAGSFDGMSDSDIKIICAVE